MLRPWTLRLLAPVVAALAPQLFNAQSAAADSSASGAAVTQEASPAISRQAENAVVKVFTTARYPDFSRPWTKQSPVELSGSGVVIDGKRILTNAHVVLYASQVQVQASQMGDRKSATVVAIAPGIDLALLKLDDESFFDNRPPLPRASALPEIRDAVLAYGFPAGGNSLSITKGIVSRIEFVYYNHWVSGLRVQVDAAINPGNSGGPAVAGDKMVGLAFSRLGGHTQNIGYIIPNEEIELFLKGVALGGYRGKPALFDDLQTLENPALRRFLKLDPAVQGMVVHQPVDGGASYPLKEWDVITRIGSTPIDDQGMVRLGSTLRVDFRYLVQRTATHGKVPLTIVRSGKTLEIQLPVPDSRPLLLPDLGNEYPAYFIYGPLVFTQATQQFAHALAAGAEALGFVRSPLLTRRGDPPDPEREELVAIASPLFPHKLSQGYSNPAGSVLASINGIRIHSLKHLVTVLRDRQDEFITFEFEQRGGEALVFPRAELAAATEEILGDNEVRAQGSPEMMKIWHEASAAR